jgi:hypothetical protein
MRQSRASAIRVAALGVLFGIMGGLYACSPESPEGGLPTHPSDGFSVTLEWDAPTQDASGRPLTDLAGYRLYYSLATPPAGPEGVRIDLDLQTRVTVPGLPAGYYYFAVTAVDAVGNESDLSAPLEVEIGE